MIRFSDDQKKELATVSLKYDRGVEDALRMEIRRLQAEIEDLREVIRECLIK